MYTQELLNHIMISSQLLHQEQNLMIEILTKEFLFFTSNYIIATLLQQLKSMTKKCKLNHLEILISDQWTHTYDIIISNILEINHKIMKVSQESSAQDKIDCIQSLYRISCRCKSCLNPFKFAQQLENY